MQQWQSTGKGVADGCRLARGSPLDLLSSYRSVSLEQGNGGRVADGKGVSSQLLEEMRSAYVGLIGEEVHWRWLSSSTLVWGCLVPLVDVLPMECDVTPAIWQGACRSKLGEGCRPLIGRWCLELSLTE
ncbi:unnamed protein product [Prunus armeniaca]|uniref:Uncharacterized protein n=1 Tax=Prunus armeniaca TaxID=36596 RepID=A0A6J5W3B1_PRUAR|nr:unnamed protein product [Prunus armeniaca]